MPPLAALDAAALANLWPILLPAALGAAAVALLLPRARPYPAAWGATAGGLAVLLAGWLLLRVFGWSVEAVLFYAFSAVAVVAGGMLITLKNPAHAALSFALVVLSSCGLFLLQAAPFLMAATIIIYAGAIIVTFLFVLMLAQQEGPSDADQRSREPVLASIAGFVLLAVVLYTIQSTYGTTQADQLHRRADAIRDRIDTLFARLDSPNDRPDPKEIRRETESLKKDTRQLFDDYGMWAKGRITPEAARKLREEPENFVQNQESPAGKIDAGLGTGGSAPSAAEFYGDPDRVLAVQTGLAWLREYLDAEERLGEQARNSLGMTQPHGDSTLSRYSGTPANSPVRRDDAGRAEMPADNTAALGRSLFTDYLIAVEVAGTVLLVATVGAIAIASRRAERVP